MKTLLYTFFLVGLLLISERSIGQTQFVKLWDNRYGGTKEDYCNVALQNLDGSLVLVGYSSSENNGDKTQACQGWDDYWVVKIDAQGNKLWDKRYGGNQPDVPFDIKATVDGGYVIVGQSASSISGDKSENSRGSFDCWVVKLDADGNKQWDHRYGTPLFDYSGYIALTKDGGYVIGASTAGNGFDKTEPNWDINNFQNDVWLIRIDSVGNKVWDKTFGGVENENCTGVVALADGSFVFAGSSFSDSSGNKTENSKGYYDFWIVKVDSSGSKIWDKTIGGSQGDFVKCFALTTDGGFLIGGSSNSGIGGDKTVPNVDDYWVVKIDSNGDKQWDKAYGGNAVEELISLTVTTDGGFLFAGTSLSDISGSKSESNLGPAQAWLLKTDALGMKEWDKTVLTLGYGEPFVLQSLDGCFVTCTGLDGKVGGYNTHLNRDISGATSDYWIMKFCMDAANGIGVMSDESKMLIIYPNPASEFITIGYDFTNWSKGDAELQIVNSIGQTVYEQKLPSYSAFQKIDVSHFVNGLYLVSIKRQGQIIAKAKFVKE